MLTIPRADLPNADTIVKLTLDGPAEEIPPLEVTTPTSTNRI